MSLLAFVIHVVRKSGDLSVCSLAWLEPHVVAVETRARIPAGARFGHAAIPTALIDRLSDWCYSAPMRPHPLRPSCAKLGNRGRGARGRVTDDTADVCGPPMAADRGVRGAGGSWRGRAALHACAYARVGGQRHMEVMAEGR